MRREHFKLVLIFTAVFIIAAGVALLFPGRPTKAPAPMPNPNGYDTLLRAARQVTGSVGNYDRVSPADLRTLVDGNTNALQLARAGLQQECRVSMTAGALQRHGAEITSLRNLALAFAAEARRAELDGRTNDAVAINLDTVRLGTQSPRGGAFIDTLVGISTESIGIRRLEALTVRLDAPTCRETAATLAACDAGRQSWDDALESEHDWSLAAGGLSGKLMSILKASSLKQTEAKARQRFNEQVNRTRRLTINLAARAYELDHGKRPASLAELVPDYLKAIPQDPLTNTNMAYTP